MIKTIIGSLLVTFATFSNCNQTPSPAETGSSDVLILLSGLMVFHEISNQNDKYEVGILEHEPDHRFSVSVDGTDFHKEMLPSVESRWTLDTEPKQPHTAPNGEQYIEKEKRRPEYKDHEYDFGWIIDLEKFHGGLQPMKAGRLKPIIELPYGALSTKYKSYDLIRWQGGSPHIPNNTKEDFGFVSETIVIPLKLRPNQKLILTGEGKEVELISKPSHPFHVVVIKNAPTTYSENSDFHHYYELFNIPPEQHYHFLSNKDHPYDPDNPFPGHKNKDKIPKLFGENKDTCCHMACTAIRTQQRLQ